MAGNNYDGQVSSTAKVLNVLDCFTPTQPELSLAQLGKMMGVPKSTLLNRIRTLENCGFLVKNKELGTYRLGYKILEYAYCVRASYPLSPVAVPIMEEVVDLTGETVYLTTHIKGRLFYMECVYPSHRPTSYSIEGRTLPLHCTASGKAMMSYMEPDRIQRIVDENGLIALTPNSITTIEQLYEELELCKSRGYAIDNEEQAIGVRCVAVAIRNQMGKPVGALSISGSTITISDDKIPQYVDYLARACNNLSSSSNLFVYQMLTSEP